MNEHRIDAEIVVVGAGTAGTQAALQLSRTGRDVVLLDRRSEGAGGARWCNGVVPWQFERAGLDVPAEPELRSRGGRVHMFSPSRSHRFDIPSSPIWEVDMRLLGDRLWRTAREAGVNLIWDVGDIELRLNAGRPVELIGSLGSPAEGKGSERSARQRVGQLRISADLFVDATGSASTLRQAVPALTRWCPNVAPSDVCSAQQLVFEIADVDGAKRFLDTVGAEAGDAVDWLGVAGGYSVQVIRVEPDFAEVSVLVGTLADGRYGTGPDLMKRTREDHPWIGRRVFGGGALIPLRRVYDRLSAPGIAVVGDAACQVMAAHGSGIGYGLIAGKVLAEGLAGATDVGSASALWRYQSSYLREFGSVLGSYDVFRRMSVALDSDGVEQLFESGIFGPTMVEPGLYQRLGTPPPADIARHAVALAKRPAIARTVTPALLRAAAVPLLYSKYPREMHEAALSRWSASATRLLGS